MRGRSRNEPGQTSSGLDTFLRSAQSAVAAIGSDRLEVGLVTTEDIGRTATNETKVTEETRRPGEKIEPLTAPLEPRLEIAGNAQSAIGLLHGILATPLSAGYEIAAVIARAHRQRNAVGLAVTFGGCARIERCFDAFEVFLEDDVDHARDCVGTVYGRSTVTEDFDAVDHRGRDETQVGGLVLQGVGKRRNATGR